MEIEIRREKRRTIAMKMIDSSHIVLKAPLKIASKEIEKFVQSKKIWIARNSARLKQRENFAKQFDFSRFVYLNGKNVGAIETYLPNYTNLSDVAKKRVLKKLYLGHFARLEQTTQEIAQKYGLKYGELKPANSARVWGSLNSKKVMKLNWKLVIVPENLARYVVCHELAHSVYFNHSPRFWAFLEKICPDCKTLKKELETYSFLLRDDANI